MRGYGSIVMLAASVFVGCESGSAPTDDLADEVVEKAPSRPLLGDIASQSGEVAEPPPPAATEGGGELDLESIVLVVPESWRRKPANPFLLAEFSLPRAEGDDADGRLTVSTAGGSIEQNVNRWRGQFGDKLEKDQQEEIDVAGLKVTRVDFSGEFDNRRGPMAPPKVCPDYRMLGAVIPVDGQLFFIKFAAPQKTAAAHAEAFDTLLGSLKRKSGE